MRALAALTLAVLSLTNVVVAQAPRRPVLRLQTGITVPSAPDEFSDYWKAGFNLGGAIGFPLTTAFGLEASLGFSNMSFNESGFLQDLGLTPSEANVTGGSVTIITASADAVA